MGDTQINECVCVPVNLQKQAVDGIWLWSCSFPTTGLEGKLNIYQIIRQIICNAKFVNCKIAIWLRAVDESCIWL